MKNKTAVNKLVDYLVNIIQTYSVSFGIEKSHNPKSTSKYIIIFIKRRRYVFRISDHALPPKSFGNMYNRNASGFFDFRPYHYREAKDTIIQLFQSAGVDQWHQPIWAANIRKIVEEYNYELSKHDNPDKFKKWSYFLYTLRAIPPDQKRKFYRMPFTEILKCFKLPDDIPSFINRIFDKYT